MSSSYGPSLQLFRCTSVNSDSCDYFRLLPDSWSERSHGCKHSFSHTRQSVYRSGWEVGLWGCRLLHTTAAGWGGGGGTSVQNGSSIFDLSAFLPQEGLLCYLFWRILKHYSHFLNKETDASHSSVCWAALNVWASSSPWACRHCYTPSEDSCFLFLSIIWDWPPPLVGVKVKVRNLFWNKNNFIKPLFINILIFYNWMKIPAKEVFHRHHWVKLKEIN